MVFCGGGEGILIRNSWIMVKFTSSCSGSHYSATPSSTGVEVWTSNVICVSLPAIAGWKCGVRTVEGNLSYSCPTSGGTEYLKDPNWQKGVDPNMGPINLGPGFGFGFMGLCACLRGCSFELEYIGIECTWIHGKMDSSQELLKG